MPVSLDPLMDSYKGVEFDPDNWYRFHGKAGAEDFRRTGAVRNNQNSKYAADEAFFSKGAGSSQYSKRGGDVLIEAHPSAMDVQDAKRGQYATKNLSKTDRIRTYEMDGGTLKPTYDNITPHKYYGRMALRAVEPVAGAMLMDDAVEHVREKFDGIEDGRVAASVRDGKPTEKFSGSWQDIKKARLAADKQSSDEYTQGWHSSPKQQQSSDEYESTWNGLK